MALPEQLLISYVQGVELSTCGGRLSKGVQLQNATGNDEAYVDGSAFFAFPADLDQGLKEDILDSTLFAQLAANAKYDRTDQAREWYEAYRKVLGHVGWAVAAFEMTKINNANAYLSVDNLVLVLAADYLVPNELDLLKRMLGGLTDAAGQESLRIFNKSSMVTDKANFQVGTSGASNGNAVLKIGGYIYTVDSPISDVLFTRFGSQSVQFLYSSQAMILNDAAYSAVRKAVKEKLSSLTSDYIESVSLKKNHSM